MTTQPFEHVWYDDQNIVVAILHEHFDMGKDVSDAALDLQQHLDSIAHPVYYILDGRFVKVRFSDLLSAMAIVTKGSLAVYKHPFIMEILVVTENTLLQLGTSALGQTQYGGLKARTFDDFEEAMSYARQQLAEQQGLYTAGD